MTRPKDGDPVLPPPVLWSRRLKVYGADKPDTLNELITTAWLLAYLTLIPLTRARELKTTLENFLGPPVIKKLILDEATPEELAPNPRKRWAQLLGAIDDTVISAESIALGLSCVQVHAQLQGTTDDEVKLQKLKTFIQLLESKTPLDQVPLPVIDYSQVYAFVEEEIANGSLRSHTGWQKRHSKDKTWRQRMKSSLDLLRERFDKEIQHRKCLTLPSDPILLGKVGGNDLRSIMDGLETAELQLPFSDFSAVHWSNEELLSGCLHVKAFQKLAVHIRTDLLDNVKQLGNECFERGLLKQAEECYQLMSSAGSNDPAFSINMAAVFLRKKKTRKNCNFAFFSAIIGLQMVVQVHPSDVIDGDNSHAYFTRYQARLLRCTEWVGIDLGIPPYGRDTRKSVCRGPNGIALFYEDSGIHCIATRRFTCQEKQLVSLECKAWLRSARAHVALADIVKKDKEDHGKCSPMGSREDRGAIEDCMAQLDLERSILIKAAQNAYKKALMVEPNNATIRRELTSLDGAIPDDSVLQGLGSLPAQTMRLHDHQAVLDGMVDAARIAASGWV